MSTALLILALLVLIGLNGFFVAAEFALVRARSDRLDALDADGAKGAGLARSVVENIDEYLSACQLGITMASIGIGFLGEVALARKLEPLFGDWLGHGIAVAVAVIVAYLIVTSAHITVGEQVPKIYAILHAEGTARRIARPLILFRTIFKPFIALLNGVSNWMLRLLGVDPEKGFEEATRSDDLKMLIARGVSGGTLDPGEAVMLSGVFHLHEQQVRNVMTPIPAVVTVDLSESVQTALQRCIDSGHTRLLVTEDENTDRVRGIVHNNSLARILMTRGPDASIESAVKEPVIVPETKPLDDLLADLQRERVSMAVVIDEYGRTAGIATVEDIIEEVVGEISDETDPAGGAVRRLANGDLYVRGHVAINDLADYGVEMPVDTDVYNSVGGLVFGELGRLPKRGDMVRVNGYSLRVESVRENRIEAVRIRDHGTEDGVRADASEPTSERG
jgi:CBS domain containing-hemolysin-like protein